MPHGQSYVILSAFPSGVTPEAIAWNALPPGLEPWARLQSALAEGTVDVVARTHMLRHAHLHTDYEVCKSLMACRHPAEMLGVQRAYLATLSEYYRDYVQEVTDRMTRCIQDMTVGRDERETS